MKLSDLYHDMPESGCQNIAIVHTISVPLLEIAFKPQNRVCKLQL